ncbi:uncharacterized protein TNIN_275471, partial [Trichonephila inaurata madagascariensis]
GFGGSSIPYKEFKDEPGSTSEEVTVQPVISYECAYCDYRSSTQKGLRCHRLTVHKIGVGTKRTLDAHEVRWRNSFHAIWPIRNCCGDEFGILASICGTCHASDCLDSNSSHKSRCLDIIKCTLQR